MLWRSQWCLLKTFWRIKKRLEYISLHKIWSFSLRISSLNVTSLLRVLWHLLKKSLMENFIFCAVYGYKFFHIIWESRQIKRTKEKALKNKRNFLQSKFPDQKITWSYPKFSVFNLYLIGITSLIGLQLKSKNMMNCFTIK